MTFEWIATLATAVKAKTASIKVWHAAAEPFFLFLTQQPAYHISGEVSTYFFFFFFEWFLAQAPLFPFSCSCHLESIITGDDGGHFDTRLTDDA